MHSFQSPSRQNSNQNCQNVVQRQGDWICYHCNNLNFSFRKRCNRCKNQTKEQNQQIQSFYKLGFASLDSRALQDKTNTMQPIQHTPSPNRKYSENIYQYRYQGLNPEVQYPLQQTPCQQDLRYESLKLGWHLFVSQQQIWEQNTLSDSAGQDEELDYQLDVHIEQMVTKLII